jgi:ribonuclease M5
MTDLLEAQLINHPQAHERRLRVGKHLRIGYANGKQLLKRLNMFQIPREQFAEAVSFLEGNNE